MSGYNVFKFGGNDTSYSDGSDSYANNIETVISFQHVPSGKSVSFKAFITAFNDTFSPDWAQEQVYGRGDPIVMFKQTSRNVTLAFRAPAASAGEAYENLAKAQQLTQFLYPSYMNTKSAQTITQPPLVRIKVMNLLSNAGGSESSQSRAGLSVSYSSANDPSIGLLAAINSLTINSNLEGDDGVVEIAKNTILPKLIDINMDFLVLHEHPLGWVEEASAFSNALFPYGALLEGGTASISADDGDGDGGTENEALSQAGQTNSVTDFSNSIDSSGGGGTTGGRGIDETIIGIA